MPRTLRIETAQTGVFELIGSSKHHLTESATKGWPLPAGLHCLGRRRSSGFAFANVEEFNESVVVITSRNWTVFGLIHPNFSPDFRLSLPLGGYHLSQARHLF